MKFDAPVFDPADFHSNKKRKKQVERASQIQEGLPEVQVAYLKEEGRFNDGIFDVFGCMYEQLGFQLLSRYRELWKIEEAFRINKHDMSLRPIYHWKPEGIRAHIAICYIAFTLLSYARIKLKEHHVHISFERLREELLKTQSSLVRDMKNNILFTIPSKATDLQKSIYNAFGLKRTQTPTLLPMT